MAEAKKQIYAKKMKLRPFSAKILFFLSFRSTPRLPGRRRTMRLYINS